MLYEKNNEKECCIISFGENITYADRQEFIKLIENFSKSKQKTLVLDLSHVVFIDSAGLGFLLITLQLTENCNKKFTIKNPRNQVISSLYNLNFDKLINIELD